MSFFNEFYSNTLAATGNQSYFINKKRKCKGKLYFPVYAPGEYDYVLYYTNIIDSTYSDGSHSYKNQICSTWTIHSIKISVTESLKHSDKKVYATFNGKKEKNVKPCEIFKTDPISLNCKKGDYICIETEFSGDMIPNHPESQIPAFVKKFGMWFPSTSQPFPSSICCNRPINKRIAYLGDSITQGIGVGFDKYNFWSALLSQKLGIDNGYWNLGLGYGRCEDAASCGIWLKKAKNADYVFVCFGVNDLYQGISSDKIINDITKIVQQLHEANCKVLVQTVPPGDYDEKTEKEWLKVNDFILNNKILGAEKIFDTVPFLLKKGGKPSETKGKNVHPNSILSEIWADNLYPVALNFINDENN